MRILFSVSFLLSVSACTINAPQVEDVEGAALSVVDGRLEIDAKQVPVLTECEIGQLVSKTSAGWVCVGAGVTDVVVGAGLTGGGTGVSNVAVDFGDSASQVATGERATALEARLTAAESDVAAHNERLTAVDGSLAIGEQLVPLLADCALGELVARTEVGWECVERGVTNVVVGAGLTGGGTGLSTVVVNFGDSASQVATGARAKALEDVLIPLSGSLVIGPVGPTQQLVPLLADCAAGKLVARTAVGWECVERGIAIEEGSGLSKSDSAGVSTLSVIFGDDASQVATGARANALEDDARTLREEFDALVDRVDELEAPTVPSIIAQFSGEDINDVSNLWPSDDGATVIALSSQAVVTLAGNSIASIQAGSASVSGGFGGGLGLTRIALPPSNFSVEMLVNSTGCIFTHGVDNTPMSLKVCIGPGGVTVNEGLVNILAVLPQGFPDMGLGTRVVHLVYVHGDTARRLYINGFPISLSPHIAGPYQGGDAPLLLGEHNFAGNAGGVIIHDLVFHGLALTQAEVRLSCRNSTPPLDFCFE